MSAENNIVHHLGGIYAKMMEALRMMAKFHRISLDDPAGDKEFQKENARAIRVLSGLVKTFKKELAGDAEGYTGMYAEQLLGIGDYY